ncbi:GNAT family N-acetyltransferase [uncultured Roseibium sp.]|uniref:GNAT family N-acetyltransferase n=1 Tax=uncultured Roseibium sp. TaxID=1936171 RepID=UPI0026249837|nr:GNAT family N-acetyltransferase [uncultured Roseibium sp.]
MSSINFVPETPVALLTAGEADAALPQLSNLLKVCVEDGAGIGFILPLSSEKAEIFWKKQVAAIEKGEAFLMVTRDQGHVTGVVMLVPAAQDNGSHRADVAKLMVHPDHRRKGLARRLMASVDGLALSIDRWLLVLDTVTGDRAELLYPTCGYNKVGIIPDYAFGSRGALDATTVFYKDLRQS